MPRPVILFSGCFAELPLEEVGPRVRDFGYDGLELSCRGDHLDVGRVMAEEGYCDALRESLARHDLSVHAIACHTIGQAVCDPVSSRHRRVLPARLWGDGEPAGVAFRAAEAMKDVARAARRLGVSVVSGFVGNPLGGLLHAFPPAEESEIAAGHELFAERWSPILDVFAECGVRFAVEPHPSQILFDVASAERALAAVGGREEFGFTLDPSHLYWQGVDPVAFLRAFPDRIAHVHVKDAITRLDGRNSLLTGHLAPSDPRRGWEFRSPGRGGVDFEGLLRGLNEIGYDGPLSVDWEDPGMDRDHGAVEACGFVRQLDFPVRRRSSTAGAGEPAAGAT
jgi:sugar phosphate isomerase/epimerase